MKIKPVLFLFALSLAAILTYAAYTIADPDDPQIKTLVISAAVSFCMILFLGLGCSFDHAGKDTNLRIVSVLFCFILVVEHFAFAFWGIRQSGVIITTGLILVIYLLSIYLISKLKV